MRKKKTITHNYVCAYRAHRASKAMLVNESLTTSPNIEKRSHAVVSSPPSQLLDRLFYGHCRNLLMSSVSSRLWAKTRVREKISARASATDEIHTHTHTHTHHTHHTHTSQSTREQVGALALFAPCTSLLAMCNQLIKRKTAEEGCDASQRAARCSTWRP